MWRTLQNFRNSEFLWISASEAGLSTKYLGEKIFQKYLFDFSEIIFKKYFIFSKKSKRYIFEKISSRQTKRYYIFQNIFSQKSKRYFFKILFLSFQKSKREDILKIYYLLDFLISRFWEPFFSNGSIHKVGMSRDSRIKIH